MSLYETLGAAPDATAEELRRAFVVQARRFHPDRHVGADPAVRREAERRMREVTEAWAVLGDPQRRQYYDLGMGDPVARGTRGTAGSAGAAGRAQPSGPSRPGSAGSSSPPRTSSPPGGWAASGPTAASAEGRSWRSYASPGPGGGTRSAAEHVLWLSPVLLLGGAIVLAVLGVWIRWAPFFAMAIGCVALAAAAFFMLPIWAMTRGRNGGRRGGRGGRGPKRAY